jgi:pseudouridine kinase
MSMGNHSNEDHILVLGSASMDVIGRASTTIQPNTSSAGQVRMSYGGTARNVAENLARLGLNVVLITAVGDDEPGARLLESAAETGINTSHVLVVPGQSTGAYLGILDDRGNLHLALDDMSVIQFITPEYLRERRELFKGAQAIFLDANLSTKTISTAVSLARRAKVPIAADPTSVSLAPVFTDHLADLWLITPNEAEADQLCPHPVPHADPTRAIDAARHLITEGVGNVIITMAEFGLGYATASSSGHIPAINTEIIDPTGAGDALAAAVMFGLLNEIPIDESVLLGLSAASLSLRTPGSVVPDLSLELLYDQLR